MGDGSVGEWVEGGVGEGACEGVAAGGESGVMVEACAGRVGLPVGRALHASSRMRRGRKRRVGFMGFWIED